MSEEKRKVFVLGGADYDEDPRDVYATREMAEAADPPVDGCKDIIFERDFHEAPDDDMARARARRQREDDVKLANAEFEIGAGIARECVAVWLVRQLIECEAVPDMETANAIGALVRGCPLPKRDQNRMLGVAP